MECSPSSGTGLPPSNQFGSGHGQSMQIRAVHPAESWALDQGFAHSLVEGRPGVEIWPIFPTVQCTEVLGGKEWAVSCFL